LSPEEFEDHSTGRLVAIGDQEWAFVPADLPPVIRWTNDLVIKVGEADRSVGTLSGLCAWLPNTSLFADSFLNREAVLSSRIEGARATLVDVLEYKASPSQKGASGDTEEVYNYALALERGLELLRTLPISRRLLCDVHRVLMDGVRGQEWVPGEFRTIQNMIGTRGQTPRTARFVPPPPGRDLDAALDALERYLNNPTTLPALVDMALVHYQFETIHPFIDGNGRIGRLLLSLMLIERNVFAAPLLYLSGFFERNRLEYQRRLLEVSKKAMWIEWIEFFLQAIIEESSDARWRVEALYSLREEYRTELEGPRTGGILAAIDYAFKEPVFNTETLRTAIGLSVPGARAIIRQMINRGVVAEKTGMRRNQVFAAEQILAILEAPARVLPKQNAP
jgi:Fic family protein